MQVARAESLDSGIVELLKSIGSKVFVVGDDHSSGYLREPQYGGTNGTMLTIIGINSIGIFQSAG